jgi:uncharacterized protein
MSPPRLQRDADLQDGLRRLRRGVRQRLRRQAADLTEDWLHVQRVWNNVRWLVHREVRPQDPPPDGDVLEAAVLLHVEPPRIHTELADPLDRIVQHAETTLHQEGLGRLVWPVCDALLSALHPRMERPMSPEACLLHDADLLDELGAIGSVRLLVAGAACAVPMLYDPDDPAARARDLDEGAFLLDAIPRRLQRALQGLVTPSGRAEGQRRSLWMQGFYQELMQNVERSGPAGDAD